MSDTEDQAVVEPVTPKPELASVPSRPSEPLRPDMSPAEVEALLGRVQSGEVGSGAGLPTPGKVRPYDLAARDRIERGRMPALDLIHERWIGEFERDLNNRIRRPVEVSAHKAQVMTYGEWLASQPRPSSFNAYVLKPWRAGALIAVDARLLFLLVDSYFGGSQGPAPASRVSLSRTEERMNRILIDGLAQHFKNAFQPIASIDLALQRTELNPHYVSIATPTEAVLVSRFDIKLGDRGGELGLVIPLAAFDSVRGRLQEGFRNASAESQARWQQCLREHLEGVSIEIAGVFLRAELSVRDLLQLKPGDILPIEMPKNASLHADGHLLLRGKFGRSRGYNAVRIADVAAVRKAR